MMRCSLLSVAGRSTAEHDVHPHHIRPGGGVRVSRVRPVVAAVVQRVGGGGGRRAARLRLGDHAATRRHATPLRPGRRQRRRSIRRAPGQRSGLVLQLLCNYISEFCLQCFDAVGWTAGMASGL